MGSKKIQLDKPLFILSVLFTALILGYTIIAPESAGSIFGAMFHWVCYDAGWLILLGGLACLILCLFVSFSRFGKIRLGGEDAKPQFSFATYAFMMFTAGVGSSLIYWAMGEPMLYLSSPPMYAEAGSLESTMWAITYPLFHWGPTAWAIYCIPGIPFAYYLHCRNKKQLRLSNLCEDVIGRKNANGVLGYIINIFAVFGTMCAVSTGIGFCADLIGSGCNTLFGTPNSMTAQLLVVLAFVGVFTATVLFGIEKGVARISDLCTYTALGLGLYVLFFGETGFTLSYYVDSLGVMFQNYVRMSTWLDPVGGSAFPHDWTVYYWAWYFAYLVMMGLFLGKISKGRTLKEMILTCVIAGSAGCSFFTGIFGGYAVGVQTSGLYNLIDWMNQDGTSAAIIRLIQTLPLGKIVLVVFLIVEFFLMATTLTSSTYSLAMMSSRNMSVNEEPSNPVKIAWAIVVGCMSIVALLMGGSISAIKSVVVAAGFPMLILYVVILIAFFKWLRKDLPTATQASNGDIIIHYSED